MVVGHDIRTRRKRVERSSSSPKVPIKYALEAPQFLSPVVEIEEVKISQEVEVIEEVQA